MFLLALQLGGNEYEWGSATIVGLFFGSGVLAIIFVIRESRVGDKAMIPSKIIKQKIAISSAIQVLCATHRVCIEVSF
jgi:high-affinity Fe2+/Pb2+ permease